MAVLAQYTPPSDSQYGRSANLFFSGMNEAQSLMERKQNMALAQQRADQQKMEFIAKLPLIQAQADLTRVNAATAVKNATDIANWETNAALESTTANKEFIDAVQYNVNSDPNYVGGVTGDSSAISTPLTDAEKSKYDTQATLDARSQKLASLSAKYSYMKNLPQYEGFIGRVDKEAATAHLAAAQNLKLEELMASAQASRDARVYGYDRTLEGRTYAADKALEGRGVTANATVEAAKQRTQHTFELEKMKALRDEALDRGDQDSASVFDARIKKLNNITKTAGAAVAEALAATPEPTAPEVAPTKPATPAKDKFTRGVIYKDPKGKRAKYLGNGQWQPLD